MDMAASRMNPRSILILIAAFALCFGAAWLGSQATTPNLGWYDTLNRPAFNPPKWVFPVAWTILYALMAIAFWRVMTAASAIPVARMKAGAVFLVHLAVNIGWSFAFFGQQNPALGLVVIAILLIAILATIFVFRPIDRLAAWLLAPYLAWVCFASILNLSIWLMNP